MHRGEGCHSITPPVAQTIAASQGLMLMLTTDAFDLALRGASRPDDSCPRRPLRLRLHQEPTLAESSRPPLADRHLTSVSAARICPFRGNCNYFFTHHVRAGPRDLRRGSHAINQLYPDTCVAQAPPRQQRLHADSDLSSVAGGEAEAVQAGGVTFYSTHTHTLGLLPL